MEEKNDRKVERGENSGEEEVDRSLAHEGADVQEVIFQNAEGKKDRRDETEISQRVDGNAADRKDREGEQKGGKTQPPEDVFDPVFLMIVRRLFHRPIENRETVDDRKGDRRRIDVKQHAGAGDPTEGIVMESIQVEIGGNDGQKRDAEQPGGNLQPPSSTNAQECMYEQDIDGNAEDEEEMDRPVDAKGQPLIGQNGNEGHIGIEERAEQADAGKQDVRPLPPAPQERN